MFPTAEATHLTATDFSALDDLCILGDNQPTAFDNMADYNFMEGILGTHALATDWLTGNVNLDLNAEDQSCQESDVITHAFSQSNSMTIPHSINADLQGNFEPPIQYPFFVESPVSEERIYSCDEYTKTESDDLVMSPALVSNTEEVFIDHNVKSPEVNLAEKKYLKMREKNNIASQRSRKLRKQKNVEMIERLKKLETENKELTLQVANMEKQRDALQKLLFEVISKK